VIPQPQQRRGWKLRYVQSSSTSKTRIVAIACEIELGDRAAAERAVVELEAEGDPGQDLLINVAGRQPQWVERVDAAVRSLQTEIIPMVARR
jgi:hypothetical protein